MRYKLSSLLATLFMLLSLVACGGGGSSGAPAVNIDTDGDGVPDLNIDTDGDGVADFNIDSNGDGTPDTNIDTDLDMVADTTDNCPAVANTDQADADGDGFGDLCDVTASALSFNWIGNAKLSVAAAEGLLSNEAAGVTISAADTDTTLGGTASVKPDGSFIYVPFLGLETGTDTFIATVTNGAVSENVTVSINLKEKVVFAQNDFGGTIFDGSQANPFTTLAAAVAAANANDIIYVFQGDGTFTGQNVDIALLPGQKLIGAGVALAFNGVTILPAGSNSVITGFPNAGDDVPVVGLSTDNEVAGLTIQDSVQEAIMGMATGGAIVSGFNIHDNLFINSGNEDIKLVNPTGTGMISNNTMSVTQRASIQITNVIPGDPNAVPAIPDIITPITASISLTGNSITSPVNDGVSVTIDGASALTLTATGNILTATGDRGFNIDSLGDATLTVILSDNQVRDSTNEAIDLQSDGNSTLAAAVMGNSLIGVGGVADLKATVTELSNSGICLELDNNDPDPVTGDATFRIENNIPNPLAFKIFEGSNNDTAVINAGNVAEFTQIPAGGCNIPGI